VNTDLSYINLYIQRYQIDGKKNAKCEADGDVCPVVDVERQSVDSVECGREDERQRQKRAQNVRFVTDGDNVV